MDFKAFKNHYFAHAKFLVGGAPYAEQLCREVYEVVLENRISEHRAVLVLFAQIYYSSYGEFLSPIESLIRRIYPSWQNTAAEELASLEECLERIGAVFCHTALLKRMVASLRLIGWDYGAISSLLNHAFVELPDQLPSDTQISEIMLLTETFKRTFLERIERLDLHTGWINSIVREPEDMFSASQTWAAIKSLFPKSPDRRFSRKNQKDAKLRDWWEEVKKMIRNSFDPDDFLRDGS